MARMAHTTQEEFRQRVVVPGEGNNGPLAGVAHAHVRAIREVVIAIDPEKPGSAVPAVCVIDQVTEYDYDGHASLKYADLPSAVSGKRLGKLREIIRHDLASQFSKVLTIERAYREVAMLGEG